MRACSIELPRRVVAVISAFELRRPESVLDRHPSYAGDIVGTLCRSSRSALSMCCGNCASGPNAGRNWPTEHLLYGRRHAFSVGAARFAGERRRRPASGGPPYPRWSMLLGSPITRFPAANACCASAAAVAEHHGGARVQPLARQVVRSKALAGTFFRWFRPAVITKNRRVNGQGVQPPATGSSAGTAEVA